MQKTHHLKGPAFRISSHLSFSRPLVGSFSINCFFGLRSYHRFHQTASAVARIVPGLPGHSHIISKHASNFLANLPTTTRSSGPDPNSQVSEFLDRAYSGPNKALQKNHRHFLINIANIQSMSPLGQNEIISIKNLYFWMITFSD